MAISTNQKPTIYRNLYENTGPDVPRGLDHSMIIYKPRLTPPYVPATLQAFFGQIIYLIF